MPPMGFEPTISAGERPKTYALDRAVTGTGIITLRGRKSINCFCFHVTFAFKSSEISVYGRQKAKLQNYTVI